MALTPWKQLSSEVIKKNPWWRYCFDKCVYPNGVEGEYHYMVKNDGVAIIAVTKEGKIMMNRQYRYLFKKESVEFPMGSVKDSQTKEEAAHAELQEEAQVRAHSWEHKGVFEPSNGFVQGTMYVYVASELEEVDVPHDDSEEFEQLLFSPDEIDQLIAEGTITDGASIASWCIAKPSVLKIIETQNV